MTPTRHPSRNESGTQRPAIHTPVGALTPDVEDHSLAVHQELMSGKGASFALSLGWLHITHINGGGRGGGSDNINHKGMRNPISLHVNSVSMKCVLVQPPLNHSPCMGHCRNEKRAQSNKQRRSAWVLSGSCCES